VEAERRMKNQVKPGKVMAMEMEIMIMIMISMASADAKGRTIIGLCGGRT
jgi:hypothetical protein